jgi:hypothetical protein
MSQPRADDAGAEKARERVSVAHTFVIGAIWVWVPIALIIDIWFVGFLAFGTPRLGANSWLDQLSINAFLLSAWLWRSFSVPKWRLWAAKHSDDWAAVERLAMSAGLIFSERTWYGRIFAHTEIWSKKDRARYEELKQKNTPRIANTSGDTK